MFFFFFSPTKHTIDPTSNQTNKSTRTRTRALHPEQTLYFRLTFSKDLYPNMVMLSDFLFHVLTHSHGAYLQKICSLPNILRNFDRFLAFGCHFFKHRKWGQQKKKQKKCAPQNKSIFHFIVIREIWIEIFKFMLLQLEVVALFSTNWFGV